MKTFIYSKKVILSAQGPYTRLKTVMAATLILIGANATLTAQNKTATQQTLVAIAKKDSVTAPSWWFGIAAGANSNYYDGTTQKLNADLTVPTAFHKGMGIGLYVAPLVEYHRADSRFGFMLQAGYDNRKGKFNQVISPCNCPADLSTKLAYVTVEPSLRFSPFKKGFYLYAGPRFAYNLDKSFLFSQKRNPANPEQVESPEIKGSFSDMKSMLISMQVGAGYDIALLSSANRTQFVLSPFVAYHPYFGQDPRNVESWNLTTLRAGLAIKIGRTRKSSDPDTLKKSTGVAAVDNPKVKFTVNSPQNIPVARRVRETFPLRNYVFFDLGSTEIPQRYVLLKKSQVKDFKEDQLEVFKPKNLSGRSSRQLVAYYNILNIVGDRMGTNPSATIRLVGSSEQGAADGKNMAESVKKYLVDIFAIQGNRITTEGNVQPEFPSRQPGGTKELDLLREGDRRVSITSTSPQMLMEFQSGPDAPLKPVELAVVQDAPLDSYVTFNVKGSEETFSSWSLQIEDNDGVKQKFGPYTQKKISLPGKDILGTRQNGNYKVSMLGTTRNGQIIRRDTTVYMALWVPSADEQGMRYSVIFGFGESETAAIYQKYLEDVVTPKIPGNSKIIIHGHSDMIGDTDNNQRLSFARAKDVQTILERSLKAKGTKDVNFEVAGFGEDLDMAPFENKYPEERSYNRTVVIDIIP